MSPVVKPCAVDLVTVTVLVDLVTVVVVKELVVPPLMSMMSPSRKAWPGNVAVTVVPAVRATPLVGASATPVLSG
jgi:hypothetical protein